MVPMAMRLSTRAWVWIRRACRLSAISIGLRRRIEDSIAPTMRTSSQVTQASSARRSRWIHSSSCDSGIGTVRTATLTNSSGSANAIGTVTTRTQRARLESRWAARRASRRNPKWTSRPSSNAPPNGTT